MERHVNGNNGKKRKGLGFTARSAVRMLSGFMLLFALYLAAYNPVMPGGGSAGGILLIIPFIAIITVFGKGVILSQVGEDSSLTAATEILTLLSVALIAATAVHLFLASTGSVATDAIESLHIPAVQADVILKSGVGAGLLTLLIALFMSSAVKGKK